MAREGIGIKQYGQVGAMLGAQDAPKWRCEYLVEKNWKASDLTHQAGDREIIQGVGNVLLNGGADIVWERLTTPAASTAVKSLDAMTGRAYISGPGRGRDRWRRSGRHSPGPLPRSAWPP